MFDLKRCPECQYNDEGRVEQFPLNQDTPFFYQIPIYREKSHFNVWTCLRCLHTTNNYPEGYVSGPMIQKISIKCIHCPYYLAQNNLQNNRQLFTCPACNWTINIDNNDKTISTDSKTFSQEQTEILLSRYSELAEEQDRDEVVRLMREADNSTNYDWEELDNWVTENYFTTDSNS